LAKQKGKSVEHKIDGQLSPHEECVSYLRTYNQTILIQLIKEFSHKSSNQSLSEGTIGDTDTTAVPDFPFVNDWYVVLIWSLIFGCMVLLAIFGNSLIIWCVLRQKVMRTVINIFLLNLTLSDLLTVSFNATFNFVFMLTGHWPFTTTYCHINNFINNLTIASSVFTATVMSIDRYVIYC
ncbi:unnamed protein product, partial [Oppiella nova]